MDSCNSVSDEVAVVMVPLPAQGHLNQLLQFCCLISSYGLPVHYIGSAIHNQQARLRANGLDPNKISKIHFHDLPTPHFDSPPPNPNAPIKFPAHMQPTWDASQLLRHATATILRELASKARKLVIIHDYLMSSVVQDGASLSNAEIYTFNCVSVLCMVSYIYQQLGAQFVEKEGELRELLPTYGGCATEEIMRLGAAQREYAKFKAGDIHNSSRLIEGPFIDLLEQGEMAQKWSQWFIGPILPGKPGLISNKANSCLDWLDQQPKNSVLYISFGTMTSMSDKEVRELALGLEQSKQRFIWVLRDADKGDIFSGTPREIEVPEGFEERVKGVGVVVRDWAPQPEILAHPSTGGFMSHCGWNSCMESITFGVPIAAWPMHSDQPINSFLVAKIIKTGLMVREWADRQEVVKSSTVENVVRRLMASEEGDEIRKRAQQLGENIRKSAQEGGGSQKELNSFIAHITR
ncbi:zeatin O-xylosyltransferase-like [Ipomoea triloba]|uniref:zeatin O-xylosyltransferase-like n=1 Tax=Ipomoea triloba TaxID=35885 RepID=UPI00125DA013|nr:zeatin O-xylosyltransferase-like [Ipomoea triloba]